MSGKEYKVRFAQGSLSTYSRNLPLFEQTVYFATDTEQLYLNGIKYGDANRGIPVVDDAWRALVYFMQHQDDIMSGKIPNVVQISNGASGNGHAVVTYDDVDNYRMDFYLSVDLSSSSKQGFVRKHTYALFADGLFYPEILDAFEYSFIPHLSESNPTTDLHYDFYGLYETWIESTNGAITKHYWDGTKYVNTLLPTSKNIALETICTYVYSFGTTPTITYGPDSITAASVFTLERMQMDGIKTQLFCINGWIVKNGKLITYADGARPMLLLNQDGKDLEVGEQIKIDCSDDALIDEVRTTGFSWSYSDNVYTLTKKYEGRQFIYLNRSKYINSISYYRAGMSKTFTVSTPDGIREITVLNDPSSFISSIAEINYDNGAIYKNYPDGSKVLLPTSKDTYINYLRRYEHSFESTPTISYGSDTITIAGIVLNQVLLNGVPTQLYCPNTWIVKSGRLITYSNGARPMVIRNSNGDVLQRGEYIKIYAGSDDILYEPMMETTAWEYEYASGVCTLTYDAVSIESPIWLNKQKYISKIEYYGEWGVKTFTISTPSGVQNVDVIDQPRNVLDDITALESRLPVGTADISDKSITKEKLAFDIAVDISAETVANIDTWINNAFK